MPWTKRQIAQHKRAGELLGAIKDEAFDHIRARKRTVREYDVQQFILDRFAHYDLKTAVADPIVAFGASAAEPHYAPPVRRSKQLPNNTPIMIDVWARVNEPRAPFADITWMGCTGTPARKTRETFETVLAARDAALAHIREHLKNRTLPTGREVDETAMQVIETRGFGKYILHRTGHSIGTTSPHGRHGHVSVKSGLPLVKNLGYTIEPGIYLPGKFGIRSEIDLYIDSNWDLRVTTGVQNDWVRI